MSRKKRITLYLLFAIPPLASLFFDLLFGDAADWDFAAKWWHTILTRTLLSASAVSLVLFLEKSPLRPIERAEVSGSVRASLISLAFLVAVNNLPLFPLLSGAATVGADAGKLFLFALGCLAVGGFEEILFRGFFFPLLLDRFAKKKNGRLFAILLSASLFGIVHLFNLMAGADILPTLLQVGYSFLIGCLAALLLLASGSLLLSILFHAVYNFAGRLVPECGSGSLWDTPTTLITLILSLAATLTAILFLLKSRNKNEA